MAKKITLQGNAIEIEDTVTGLLDHSLKAKDCWYDEKELESNSIVKIYFINGDKFRSSVSYAIADTLDASDVTYTKTTFRDFARDSMGFSQGGSSSLSTGWGTYVDTVYLDSGSSFSVSADTDTALPNNAGSKIESQMPPDVTTFYNGTTITGRNGDSLDIMLYFKAVPSSQNQYLDLWIDIGGGVGELYRQTFSFPRGSGVERGILYSLSSAYTLGTWEANGGTVYVRSNAQLSIYAINYNFDRSHKAR